MRVPLVVATKIHLPRLREEILHRQRLVDFLHASIDRKLVLVSAAAGYGKTALVLGFADESDLPVCWYNLDPYDRDIRTFVAHLVASLRTHFPNVGERTLAALAADTPSSQNLRSLAATLVNELYESVREYFVIALDDYHAVDEQEEISEFLGHFLQLSDENCHLILVTRTLPSLPNLALLTSRGQVAGLDTDQLRFTPEEIRALLQQNYRVDLAIERATELCQAAEGWITGILLSAQRQDFWQEALDGISLGPKGIGLYDYLAEQVLYQQPEAVRSFLMDTSVFEEVSPSLCEALLGDGNWSDLLSQLVRNNLFVIVVDTGGEGLWLRYHALLRDFLQDRLARTAPERFEALQRRAANIYRQRHEWERAATIYLRLDDRVTLAELTHQVGPALYRAGKRATLETWLDALPAHDFTSYPNLLMLKASLLMDRGDLPEALALYDHAETLFAEVNDVMSLGRVFIRKATIARFQGAYQQAMDLCRQTVQMVGDQEDALNIVAEAKKTIGISYFWLGDALAARTHQEEALRLYQHLGDAENIAMLHHELGILERAAGKLEAALSHYRSALVYWQQIGDPSLWATTLNSVGVIYYLRGEYEQAQQALYEALTKAREISNPRVEGTVLASLGDAQRDAGAFQTALSSYGDGLEAARRAQDGFLITYVLNALAVLYLRMGDLARAEEYLQMARSRESGSSYDRSTCLITAGILSREAGQLDESMAQLEEAASLLEASDMRQELAWAQLHLAMTCFQRGDTERARALATAAIALTQEIGIEASLVVAGTAAIPLLRHLAAENVHARHLLHEIEDRERDSRPEKKALAQMAQDAVLRLKIHTFGQPRVFLDGTLVSNSRWATAKARELFFCLLSHADGLRKEQIGFLFWPDHSQERLNGIFRSTMYRMRRALYTECVIFDEELGIYRFNRQIPHWYDADAFEQGLGEAERAASEEERAAIYQQAVDLYTGSYLEDCYEDWCFDERERLSNRFMGALDAMGGIYLRRGAYQNALKCYRRLLAEDPYREETHRQVIRCHLEMEDRAAAARQLRECTRLLQEELRISPSRETLALRQEIVA